jgi:DNA-binding NtrC family response regulator
MRKAVKVLLLFHQARPYSDLKAALEKLAFPTLRAESFGQASKVLSRANPPLLVFTESELPDGDWSDVVSFSSGASSHVSVIVVGQGIDTKLYASVINMGARDFIAPPFEDIDLAHVVRCAADNALARRQAAVNSRPSV